MVTFIDRRPEAANLRFADRERFLRRHRGAVQRAFDDLTSARRIEEVARAGTIAIPLREVRAPSFSFSAERIRDEVHAGNRTFRGGEPAPFELATGKASGPRDGQIAVQLSDDEALRLFCDALRLPGHLRRALATDEKYVLRGVDIAPASGARVHLLRSVRNAVARRAGARSALHGRAAELESAPPSAAVSEEVASIQARLASLSFLAQTDLRYRSPVEHGRPTTQAVLCCLMDPAGSMDARRRGLAKRYFALLYLLLARRYEVIVPVFLRHSDTGDELDESDFFGAGFSCGTVIAGALDRMRRIIEQRFSADHWDVYGAQASDGDVFGADPEKARALLAQSVLPVARHFSYIEIPDAPSIAASPLWRVYARLSAPNFALRRVLEPSEIHPVLGAVLRDGRA
jgi:uncharacterized protein